MAVRDTMGMKVRLFRSWTVIDSLNVSPHCQTATTDPPNPKTKISREIMLKCFHFIFYRT